MKTKRTTFFLIVCALLCAALLFTLVSFISVKSEVKELEAEVMTLLEENQQLTLLNQALQTQLKGTTGASPDGEFYCELIVDDWSQDNGNLNVQAFAQAALPIGAAPNARIELWRGSTVIETKPITLSDAEADGIFETEASLSFHIPAIETAEELELWLIVDADGLSSLFTCGAGWYLEGDQLMIIAG